VKALEEKIIRDGLGLGTDVIKVDSFLNHQIEVPFLLELGQEFSRLFAGSGVNKILTMESSGIAVAFTTAMALDKTPVVFAKKGSTNTMDAEVYRQEVKSFTKGTTSTAWVAKKFLDPQDKVLVIDDFLAHGEAALSLVDIVRQAGATLCGVGVVIEKRFQGGGNRLRDEGIKLESLAIVEKIEDGVITFG